MLLTFARAALFRAGQAGLILLLVSILLFAILRVLPVDPAALSMPPTATRAEIEAKRQEMGLDRPIAAQYAIWLSDALRGDFGTSGFYRRQVGPLIANALPQTVELVIGGALVMTVLGIAGGLLLFRFRGTAGEQVGDVASTVLMSIPEFLWALFLILLLGVALQVFPFTGRLGPQFQRPDYTGFLVLDALLVGRFDIFRSALAHLVLPSLAIGFAFAPPIMRVLRSSLLDVYHEDYIAQARLRGLTERQILLGQALRNAFLPTLTLIGVQIGFMFGSTLIVEVIYSYPGIGNLMVDAVRNADLPIIQAVGLTYCVVVLAINVVVDVLYVLLNPKLRAT